jgi:hypothetical protein
MKQNLSSITYTSNAYNSCSIVKTDIYEDRIEVIYRCEPTFTTWPGNNYPKIYKEIYSRTDGSMHKVDGTYIPEQHYDETYEF